MTGAPPTVPQDSGAPTLPEPLGGVRRFVTWRGYRVAITELGSGAPLVLVHSIHAAAWSMEWRNVAAQLAQSWRVISIDLLGFGASDRPDIAYSAELFTALITDVVREVAGEPAVLVGSSLGGAYVLRVAATHPELVRAVSLIGPAGISRLRAPGGAVNRWVQRLFRSAVPGRRLFNGLTSRFSIRFFLRDIYADRGAMTPATVDLYWRGAHQPGARFGPAAFVGMALNVDVRADLATVRCPVQLLWGREASQTPIREAAEAQAIRPWMPFVALPGGDLPHDEQPAAFVAALQGFLAEV